MQYLLNQHNFEILKIFHSANNEYLTAYFKNNDYHNKELKLFSASFADYKKDIKDLFLAHQNKKVAVWGAGGKGIALLSMCDISNKNILFVIDSDPHKQGKYTRGSHILIVSPDNVNFKELDLVVIFAVMYQQEILKDLRERYRYKNRVAVIVPKPHFVR